MRRCVHRINQWWQTIFYENSLINFVQQCHSLSEVEFQTICWDGISRGLSKFPETQHATMIKFMHRWLPMNHKLTQQLCATNSGCPRCISSSEMQDHIFHCQSPEAIHSHEITWKTFISTVTCKAETAPEITDEWNQQVQLFLTLPAAPLRHCISTPSP